jgi:hypothetical protein
MAGWLRLHQPGEPRGSPDSYDPFFFISNPGAQPQLQWYEDKDMAVLEGIFVIDADVVIQTAEELGLAKSCLPFTFQLRNKRTNKKMLLVAESEPVMEMWFESVEQMVDNQPEVVSEPEPELESEPDPEPDPEPQPEPVAKQPAAAASANKPSGAWSSVREPPVAVSNPAPSANSKLAAAAAAAAVAAADANSGSGPTGFEGGGIDHDNEVPHMPFINVDPHAPPPISVLSGASPDSVQVAAVNMAITAAHAELVRRHEMQHKEHKDQARRRLYVCVCECGVCVRGVRGVCV